MAAFQFKSTNMGTADLTTLKELQRYVDAVEARLAALETAGTTYLLRDGSNANLGAVNVASPALYSNSGVVTVGTA